MSKRTPKENMLTQIFDEIMENLLGGDINADASEISENSIVLHCWDGRRYLLTCAQMKDGCAYNTITGKPMTQAKWNEACERNRKRNLKEVL
ncbi:MAG TPA: hypothetical protein VMX17_14525, partial [Candidatus Glassbacteria bacterium]|nr:hypothetical protein [Candidatus Glassbacteria bacterium]